MHEETHVHADTCSKKTNSQDPAHPSFYWYDDN